MSNPIYGGTAGCCLYWIDENENKDTPTVSAGATFNVDNPSFWTNLSVLSGLASGYCERLAVAKLASAGTAITAGAKAELVTGNTWTMGPTVTADVTSNGEIVSKVMNGFALGKTDANLFTTSQAAFRTVGTSLGSNYMRSVDSAIISMCDIPGGYVQGANDTNAYTFSDLATAAKARSEIESVAGSAIDKPTANGGTLAHKGALAYPVAWAKQRKWMLDTLRYTGSSVAVTGTSVGTFTAQRISGSATNDTTFTSRGTTTETGVFISGLADLSGKINQAKIGDISYRLTGILPGQTATNQNITLYLDPHAAAHEDSPRYIDYGSLTRVTTVQQAANEQSYHVESGGTLNFNGTQAISATTVVIDAGGVVNMQNSQAKIANLSEMPGCTFNPYINGATVYIPTENAIAYRFTVPDAEWRTSGSCTYYNTDATVNDAAFIAASAAYDANPTAQNAAASAAAYADLQFSGKMWVCNGATVQLKMHENSNVAYVSNGTVALSSTTNTDSWGRLYQCVVDNAGNLVINSGTYVEMAVVRSGGSATVYGGTLFRCLVEPGGTLHLAGNCTVAWLSLYDGATFNAYSGTASTPVAITVTWTGSEQIIAFHHFCTYNMFGDAENITVDTKLGWRTITCSYTGNQNTYFIAGAETAAAGNTVIANYMQAGLSQASTRIAGTVKFNATTYTNPESGCKAVWPQYTSVYYGAAITAKNRRPDIAQPVNHYQDFRVRQWSEDSAAT